MKQRGDLRDRWPEALIVLQSLIYGFGDPISKIAFEVTPLYTMLSVRYSIAFIAAFLLFRKSVMKTLKTVPVMAWLLPGLCMGLSYVLNNIALSLTEATSVAFLRSLSVVFTPLLAFVIYRQRYRIAIILIQIMVLPGMYLLCVRGGMSGFGAGEAVSLAAAVMSAGALVSSRRYLGEVDPAAMTTLMAGCSAALALAGSFLAEGGIHLETTTPKAWLIILYLGIACTLFGYLMQNLALTKISERSVALLQSLCPVLTAVFAFLLLGERLNASGLAGAALIILCVTLATVLAPEEDNR